MQQKRNPKVPCRKLGAPGRIRTRDPLVRSQVLYPTELPARLKGFIIINNLKKSIWG